MCDVPSIAVFCSEPIECFPGTVSKFFFKLLVTIPVAPILLLLLLLLLLWDSSPSDADVKNEWMFTPSVSYIVCIGLCYRLLY